MRLFARARPATARTPGEPRDSTRPLAVMHIPKTSGMALIGALAAAVRPRQLLSGFDLSLFGGFDRFDTIAPELRRAIHFAPDQVPRGADMVAAHMAYSTLAASYPAAQLVTFLREPRARLLSHFVYWRAQTPDAVSPWGAWATVSNAARDPLAVFLQRRDVAAQTDNLALRMLLFPHPAVPRDGFIVERDDATVLAEALARLDRFAHADVIENPGLVAALSAWCGHDMAYPTVNETPPVPAPFRVRLEAELTQETLDLLAARSRLDARLWAALAERHTTPAEVARLAEAAFARGIARSARLLAPARLQATEG